MSLPLQGTLEILRSFFGCSEGGGEGGSGAEAAGEICMLDVGSGLGNFNFMAGMLYGVRSVGLELHPTLARQSMELVRALCKKGTPGDVGRAKGLVHFVQGDAKLIESLEGVTHLYDTNIQHTQT